MNRNIRIAVIGGGICGLTTALSLASQGFKRIEVYERTAALTEIGAGLTLPPNATRALRDLGLGDALQRVADEPSAGYTRHWRTGALLLRNERMPRLLTEYGAPYYQIHRADMLELLAQHAARQGAITLHTGMPVVAVQSDAASAELKFQNGETQRVDVVIACDGLKSVVRQTLFNDSPAQFSGYVAWRALVPTAAFGVLLDPPAQLFIGIERMFMRYLVRHGELINIVAIARSPGWNDEGWTIPSTVKELRSHYLDWHEDIVRTIDLVPPEQCFKWAIYARQPLAQWHNGAVALAGDAAHPMVPFMGMGASTAIEDAIVVARALAQYDCAATAFTAYQTARHGRASFIQEQSLQRGLRLMSTNPDSYGQTREVSEDSLGLFAYDASNVPI